MASPFLLFTQGDPAGIGPELILSVLSSTDEGYRPVVVAERAALEAVREVVPGAPWSRLIYLDTESIDRPQLETESANAIPVLDPVGASRRVEPGRPTAADAFGAMAALDLGSSLAQRGVVDALVTLPISKASIAQHIDPEFRGHTDYLAAASGLERYGRDYLMAFVAPGLNVALLTVHQPLREALDSITREAVVEALLCLDRHTEGSIALAGLNPHAGEGGLMGTEEQQLLAPAVEDAQRAGVPVTGPLSADSLFAKARAGAFEWVLALYHDQGLIAVKTAEPAASTNWTLGLPFLRTSVDHGTAFDIAGRGVADPSSLLSVVETTRTLLSSGPNRYD